MKLDKVTMPKKCDFCVGISDYYFFAGMKGYIFVCESCLKKLKKQITGELNGKKD